MSNNIKAIILAVVILVIAPLYGHFVIYNPKIPTVMDGLKSQEKLLKSSLNYQKMLIKENSPISSPSRAAWLENELEKVRD